MAVKAELFNPRQLVEKLSNWIKSNFQRDTSLKKLVIDISGNVESYTLAALCVRSVGADNVIGVFTPSGVQNDISDAYRTCREFNISNILLNTRPPVETIFQAANLQMFTLNRDVTSNLYQYIRSAIHYWLADNVSGMYVSNVTATESYVQNLNVESLSGTTLYPFAHFTHHQVCLIGKELGVPADILQKKPVRPENNVNGTYVPDEAIMKVSIADIDTFLEGNENDISFVSLKKIDALHRSIKQPQTCMYEP